MLSDRVVAGIGDIVSAQGMELVHAEWNGARRRGTLRLVIDRDGGVSLDDCEKTSKLVGAWLDVEDPFPGSYNLEVSSPGLDRLLYRPEDYRRFIGRNVRVSLHHAIDGRKLLIGRLAACDGEKVVVVDGVSAREYNLGFPDIRWTRLEIEL